MKKVFKFMAMALIVMIASFDFLNVEAQTAPSTIKLKSKSSLYYFSEKDGTDYISGYNFYRKELTDGSLAYCASNINTKVPAGLTLTLKGVNNDMGLNYIIQNGYPNKSFTGNAKKDYYITQSAIWEYYDKTRGSNNWKNTKFDSSSTGMKGYVYQLVQGALAAVKDSYPTPTISLTYSSTKLTLKNGYFVSSPIKVNLTNTTGTYTVKLEKATKGTIIKDKDGNQKNTFKNDEEFIVYVPNSDIASGKGSITLSINATGVIKKTYIYTPNKSGYQDIIPMVYTEYQNISEKLVLNYDKEVTKVKISKQDITTKKELPGATLVIKDKNGKQIDKWVSTNEPHYIEGLAPGEYTLTEIIAPDGYKLSTETIKFTVKDDGSITTVVMYNAPKEVTKVKISKQDITTKKEVPGATLIIKDKDGKEVAKWVSTNEPHYIEGLDPGEYTLTEIVAPEGYKLSTETKKFTVKDDGSITTVVMYNAPKEVTKVKISKQDITTKTELPGATLIIKDKDGKEVAKWVSTNEPHYIEGLAAGEYTLTEVIAPEGYKLSSETIKFTVKDDGSVTEVVMYNSRTTIVKISKQDITTKTELPGATLIVKDKDGKEIDKWVSTNEPHYIEGLEPGEYTLTEEKAPDGYMLSTETINFTVKADGTITEVVMYNSLYDVPITDLNVSQSLIIFASILVILGTGMVVYYAKFSK